MTAGSVFYAAFTQILDEIEIAMQIAKRDHGKEVYRSLQGKNNCNLYCRNGLRKIS